MKVWHITPYVSYGGNLLYNLINNAKRIPEPLPWITPPINCLDKEAVSRVVRNKSAYYVIPILLKKCAKEEKQRKYINKYELPENNSKYWYETHLINWGSFYHGARGEFAEDFLQDVTKELFFLYDWSVEKLLYSFEHARKEFGKIET